MNYTPEQQAVLAAQGKIIVSASAGSGKTSVMVERIIRFVLSGVDVGNILAVTFTKKAAAQMKEKIQKSLIARLNDDSVSPQQRDMLRTQLDNLPSASISTIDSFCSKLVRSHFFMLGIDGNAEIMAEDDAEQNSMRSQALDDVFSTLYEQKDEDFLSLLSLYYRSKNDNKLKAIVLETYDKLRIRADYREELIREQTVDETLFDRAVTALWQDEKEQIAGLLDSAQTLQIEMSSLQGGDRTKGQLLQLIAALEQAKNLPDYFALRAFQLPHFERKESAKKDSSPVLIDCIEQFASLKKRATELFKQPTTPLSDPEQERERALRAQSVRAKLSKLILRFDEAYTNLKTERAKLDYNDLEHYTLLLLQNESVTKQLQEKYKYVFVDEYQDINPVQESIIDKVAGENVFLVGDVKQSIYAFRGGRSKYFVAKCKEFGEKSLYLNENFRSCNQILGAVNKVFSRAMTSAVCDVNYKDNVMRGGSRYGTTQGRVQVHFYTNDAEKEKPKGVYSVMEEYERSKTSVEEDTFCQKVYSVIQNEIKNTYFEVDTGEVKPVTYGDIVILSRSFQKEEKKLITYLAENGVPVSTTAKVNLCDFPEIAQLTDMLSFIDNREQDIPLCSSLLSQMGGLTNEDLVQIRLRYQKDRGTFRDCVRYYAEQFETDLSRKIQKFYELLQKYVALSVTLTCGELAQRLIAECGQDLTWLAMTGGEKKLFHVDQFILAMGDKNLHEFLLYLKQLDYELESTENDGENAVRVMTMHASKGLEFPVVLCVGLDKELFPNEFTEVAVSETYGIVPRYFDDEKKLVYETIVRQAVKLEEHTEDRKSELNLLYVAMTRAKFALHFIMEEQGKEVAPYYAKTFSDLLPASLFAHDIALEGELTMGKEPVPLLQGEEGELQKRIIDGFAFTYPHREDTLLAVKSSASQLLQEQEDEFTTEEHAFSSVAAKDDVGTAYHAFLQYADFAKGGGEEYDRMQKEGVLPQEQFALLKRDTCQKILSMPVFKRLAQCTLYKEQPFMANIAANQVTSVTTDCEVLYQGFIDLVAVGKEGVQIVDYKYSSRSREGIIGHYAPQILLYKKAVAKILKINEKTIKTTIVNIQSLEEIPMEV